MQYFDNASFHSVRLELKSGFAHRVHWSFSLRHIYQLLNYLATIIRRYSLLIFVADHLYYMLAIPLRMFKCSLKLTNCNLNLYDGYLKLFWLIIIIMIIITITVLYFYIAL